MSLHVPCPVVATKRRFPRPLTAAAPSLTTAYHPLRVFVGVRLSLGSEPASVSGISRARNCVASPAADPRALSERKGTSVTACGGGGSLGEGVAPLSIVAPEAYEPELHSVDIAGRGYKLLILASLALGGCRHPSLSPKGTCLYIY